MVGWHAGKERNALDALLWAGLMGHKSINHDCIYQMPYH